MSKLRGKWPGPAPVGQKLQLYNGQRFLCHQNDGEVRLNIKQANEPGARSEADSGGGTPSRGTIL